MNKKRYLTRRIFSVCWTGFSVVIISIAVFLSIVRMLLPLVDGYRNEIEQWLGAELNQQLKMERISADWTGLHPTLVASGVSLLSVDGKSTWLDINEVKVSLNVLSLLYSGQIEIGVIKIIGTSLSLEHHDDGGYSINSIRLGGGDLSPWLFSREHISILDSEFNLRDPGIGDGVIQFKNASILLENFGQYHQLRGSLSLPEQEGRHLSFVLDVVGDIKSKPEELSTRFYAEGDALLGPWLRKWGFKTVKFNAGETKFHIWAGGSLKKASWVEGNISLRDLKWHLLPHENTDNKIQLTGVNERVFNLNKVSGNFFWTDVGNGWSLDVEQFDFSREIVQAWPPSDFSLAYRQSSDNDPQWEGRFGFLRLQDLNTLLLSNTTLGSKAREMIHTLDPKGDLYDFVFSFKDKNDEQPAQYFFKAQFENLALNRWGKVPGFSGFDGDLILNDDSGFLQLSTREASVDFGTLFRDPMRLDELAGKIFWKRTERGMLFESGQIKASNQDVNAESRFTLLHTGGEESPLLDLQGSFKNGSINQARHYLPVRIMRPGLVSWLDNALVGGRVKSGGVLVHGKLADFPFDAGKGVFDVRFTVDDAILQYGEAWPRAEEMGAEIIFHGRTFKANIDQAKIVEMDVLPTTVTINNMTQNPELELGLEVSGSTPDLLRFLRESPAGGDYGNILSKMESKGDSNLSLNLRLPIFNQDQRTFNGQVSLSDSDLLIQNWGSRITNLKGKLDYSYAPSGYKFTADQMAANFNGEKARIDVKSLDNTSGANEKHINIYTHIDIKNLLGEEYTGQLSKIMEGEADWMLGLQVKPKLEQSQSAVLHLESDLKGVKISMPGDLKKSANQVRPFAMNISLTDKGIGAVVVDYDQALYATFLYDEENKKSVFSKGAIHFGDKQVSLPEQAGLGISGYLPVVSLSEWKDWLNVLSSDDQQGSMAEMINKFDIKVDRLELPGLRFHELKLNALKQPEYWDIEIQSQEISGNVRLPSELDGDDPIVLDLDKLHIQVLGEEKTISLNPERFPALRLSSESFRFDNIDFGKTSLVARKVQNGLLFETIKMNAPNLEVLANGSWVLEDDRQISSFSIYANSQDLGQVLRDWGYEGAIDGGMFEADLKANWEGQPTAFKLEVLNGELEMKIRNGQLLPIKTAGGKIFGLLSLQALPRRLSLDFSDLFKKGFGFDSIKGTFSIAEGEAYTNDFYMVGPSARIEASGRVGLASRDYDQYVSVTPLLSSSIPVIGGLAGGPGVGLGLWIADRMFGNEINKMSRVQYTITGSWEKPVIKRIGNPDDDVNVEGKMRMINP